MPQVYIHAAQSLLAYGRAYFDEHQRKDAAHAVLGRLHRSVDHDWYNAFGQVWDFEHPIPQHAAWSVEQLAADQGPDAAEIYQAIFFSHDFLDRVHDGATKADKKLTEGLHIFLLLHPEIIESKFQVDVILGRIHREIDGRDVWESSPDTVRDYERLRAYVERVIESDPELRRIVTAFDKEYRRQLRSGAWR